MAFTMSKTLNNGVEIPVLGLGVFESASATRDAVRFALENGYRHIDTAKFYGNEQDVFQGIVDSNIPRKEVFVTTKSGMMICVRIISVKLLNKVLKTSAGITLICF